MQPITPSELIALIDREGAKGAGHYCLKREAGDEPLATFKPAVNVLSHTPKV